jgi:hypothetical protein
MAIHWSGNARNWTPEAWKVVREIERLYNVHCYGGGAKPKGLSIEAAESLNSGGLWREPGV